MVTAAEEAEAEAAEAATAAAVTTAAIIICIENKDGCKTEMCVVSSIFDKIS